MRQFTMTVTALTVFAAMVATAQAESINGAPLKNGNQCFTYSKGNDKDARFGSWGACPQAASASVAATPRVSRRSRSASR
jgi:hypothetical protein